jgi:hypothetical protein
MSDLGEPTFVSRTRTSYDTVAADYAYAGRDGLTDEP